MKPFEAEQVVGKLLAGYPGRDMADTSVAVFCEAALRYEFHAGVAAVERAWKASPEFLPGVGLWEESLRIEGRDPNAFDPGRNPSPALPQPEWTAEDERESREGLARVMAEYRERHPNAESSPIFDEEPDPIEKFQEFADAEPVMHPMRYDDCTGSLSDFIDGHRVCRHCGECRHPDHPADCGWTPKVDA